MPLPEPASDETRDDFVRRCMADETMNKEFPDQAQRAAVCYRQWDAAKANAARTLQLLCEAGDVRIEAQAAEGQASLPKVKILVYTGGPLRLQGWRLPVVIDLAGLQVPSQTLPLRYNHNPDSGVGHTDTIQVSQNQVVATGVISRDTPAAREIIASARNGFPWRASIGATVLTYEMVKPGTQVQANGKSFDGPLYLVRQSQLDEISLVDLGADRNSFAAIAAQANTNLHKTGEINMNEDEPKLAPPTDDLTPAAVIARAKRERQRLDTIKALVEEAASRPGVDIEILEKIAAQAESEGWTPEQAELAILRATRPQPPKLRADKAPTQEVLVAALCLAAGVNDERLAKDRDFGADVVERAWPFRRLGMRGVLATALKAQGFDAPHGARAFYDALREAQHSQVQAAGFSSINLPGILGATANKLLLDAFTAVEVTYETIADQADFSNFHTHTLYRLDHLGEFAQVAPTGELKHGQLSETSFTNKLDTYGQMLTLSRQAIVNDDLGAFRSLTAQLARKARLAVEKALYQKVMEATDSFYTAAKGNKLTANPLSIDGLGKAEAAMFGMADAGGDPIYATPRYLLVPPQLKPLADQIYVSTTLAVAGSTDKQVPRDNPFRGRFPVVVSPYLASSAIPGYSSTTWYLLANPALLPAFQVAYLDGRRAPTIESSDASFEVLGLSMRCYFDFGTAQLDYRGAIKNVAS